MKGCSHNQSFSILHRVAIFVDQGDADTGMIPLSRGKATERWIVPPAVRVHCWDIAVSRILIDPQSGMLEIRLIIMTLFINAEYSILHILLPDALLNAIKTKF